MLAMLPIERRADVELYREISVGVDKGVRQRVNLW